MTRERAKELLLFGNIVYMHSWWFTGFAMNCDNDCCWDTFKDVEEALDTIERHGEWTEVHE